MFNALDVAIPLRNDIEELIPAMPHDEEVRTFESSDFEFVRFLGNGRFSKVSLSRYRPTGDLFAIKEVDLFEFESDVVERELRVLETPRRNVIGYAGHYFEGSCIYLVLEYMDAGTLNTIMKQLGDGPVGSLPEDAIASIASQLLDGLIELQDPHPGIIHRDIKPDNILVNLRGEAKLADFNTSRALLSSSDKGKTCIGTCLYMSPERIEGNPHDSKADIWSLGLTLLECALGRYPYPIDMNFSGSIEFKLMQIIVNHPSPSGPDTYSNDFNDFISICLQKNPADRTCARDLKNHPFIQNAKDAAWLAEFLRPLYQ